MDDYTIFLKKARELKQFVGRIKTEYINSRSMETFINCIKGKVDVVIDVRYNTFFKKNQGFSQEEFKKILNTHRIEYMYLQDLGNPYHKLNKNNPKRAKQVYLNYLKKRLALFKNKDFSPKRKLKNLYNKIAHKQGYITKTFCLVCYCATLDPEKCHRFWLKEALINLKRMEMGMPGNYEIVVCNQTSLVEES